MKKDYRFWEQNFNPITMQPNDNNNHSYTCDLNEMGKSQKKREAIQARQADREVRLINSSKVKRIGKFW